MNLFGRGQTRKKGIKENFNMPVLQGNNLSIEELLEKRNFETNDFQRLKDIANIESQQHNTQQSGIPAFRTALNHIFNRRKEIERRDTVGITELRRRIVTLEQEITTLRKEQDEIR